MGAFITNFQSPVELEDLIDRYEKDGLTNIDYLLENRYSTEWTVSRYACAGDIALFMCAKTSKEHMGHVCAEARRCGDEELLEFAEQERELYRRYAGQIVAVGVVKSKPFQLENSGYTYQYWRSPWYARIDGLELLNNTVNISEFRDFITVSRTGAITTLTDEQWGQIKSIICRKNTNISFS